MPDRIGLPSDVFVNRELSWLEFNRRVLEEAQDPTVPLMERVKFLAIFSANLDEFFMVRVAELKRRIRAGDPTTGPDGLSPAETMAAVADKVHRLVDAQHRCFLEDLGPILASEGIRLVRPKEVTPEQERFLDEYFQRTLMPVLTPLAIDRATPSRTWPTGRSASWSRSGRRAPACSRTPRSRWSTSRARWCRASCRSPARPASTRSSSWRT